MTSFFMCVRLILAINIEERGAENMKENVAVKEDNRELLKTSGLTLSDIYTSAKDISENSEDFMVQKVDDTKMFYDGFENRLRFLYTPVSLKKSQETKEYTPTDFAMGQLCSKIGIPFNYIQKCCSSGRGDLATDNVQSWLSDYRKDLFIRTHRDNVRGVLTNRYSVCDSDEVMDVVCGTKEFNRMNVKGSFISPDRFHLRMVDTEPFVFPSYTEDCYNDLYPGITIDSSDVGRCSLFVTFFIYKKVCTNGLVIPKITSTLFRQKHIGISKDNFSKALSLSIKSYEEVKGSAYDILLNVSKEECKNMFNFAQMELDKKRKEQEQKWLSERLSISDTTSEKVIKLFQKRVEDGMYPNSKFGLVNAVTELAQEYSLETRLQMERSAGRFLVS